MTQNEFLALCLEHYIAPEIALENAAVVAALAERNDAKVKRLLEEEF